MLLANEFPHSVDCEPRTLQSVPSRTLEPRVLIIAFLCFLSLPNMKNELLCVDTGNKGFVVMFMVEVKLAFRDRLQSMLLLYFDTQYLIKS